MPYAEDECEEVSPSDVLVHGRGSIEEVLEVLRDVRSVQQASGRGGIARKFDSPNEFEELVKRVRDARATVVLWKLFLYRLWGGQEQLLRADALVPARITRQVG